MSNTPFLLFTFLSNSDILSGIIYHILPTLFILQNLQFDEYEYPSGANCSLGHLPVLYVVCWLFLIQLPNTSLQVVLSTLLPST